jgi:RND family efflux transporter MFP subunit
MNEAEAADPAPKADELAAPGSRGKVWMVVTVVSTIAIAGATANALGLFEAPARTEGGKGERSAAPVKVAAAVVDDLTLSAQYPGELDAEIAELSAQVTGRLEDVRVGIGDKVKKGDLLARIDAGSAGRQVGAAQAQTRAADANKRRAAAELKAARVELERGKKLFGEQLISAQELAALEARIEVLEAAAQTADAQHAQSSAEVGVLAEAVRDARLRAPFDGAVSARPIDPGTLVRPGATILRLVRAGPLKVRFRAPERDLGRLEPGLGFRIATHATGDQTFDGKLTRISAEVSRADRTIEVEGLLDAESAVLKPGMYADVLLTLGEIRSAVVVPSAAIVDRKTSDHQAKSGVFVVSEQQARWTSVAIRGRSGDRTAVTGLPNGASVITLGHENLKDGARVQVAEDAPP